MSDLTEEESERFEAKTKQSIIERLEKQIGTPLNDEQLQAVDEMMAEAKRVGEAMGEIDVEDSDVSGQITRKCEVQFEAMITYRGQRGEITRREGKVKLTQDDDGLHFVCHGESFSVEEDVLMEAIDQLDRAERT